jgi:hypothetical protein
MKSEVAAGGIDTFSNHLGAAGPFLFDDLIAIESSRPAFVRSSLESVDAGTELFVDGGSAQA